MWRLSFVKCFLSLSFPICVIFIFSQALYLLLFSFLLLLTKHSHQCQVSVLPSTKHSGLWDLTIFGQHATYRPHHLVQLILMIVLEKQSVPVFFSPLVSVLIIPIWQETSKENPSSCLTPRHIRSMANPFWWEELEWSRGSCNVFLCSVWTTREMSLEMLRHPSASTSEHGPPSVILWRQDWSTIK